MANVTAVRLTWDDPNAIEGGYRVYRSLTPFDPETAPDPLGELPPDATYYMDATTEPETTYYYRVSAFLGSVEQFGALLSVTTGPGVPRLLEQSVEEVEAIDADPVRGVLLSGDVQETGNDQIEL